MVQGAEQVRSSSCWAQFASNTAKHVDADPAEFNVPEVSVKKYSGALMACVDAPRVFFQL